jgi:tRNA(fMet)-specific endonuclease VapC
MAANSPSLKNGTGQILASKLLDSDLCVAVIRGRAEAIERYQFEAQNNDLRISAITAFELFYGVHRSGREREEMAKVQAFIDGGPSVADLDTEDAGQAAHIRAALAAQGQMIGAYDVLIAGQARARGWTLLSANIREFSRVEGLAVEDWRASL